MVIRTIQDSDRKDIRAVLADSIKDKAEVEERLLEIFAQPDRYLVYENSKCVVGIMGFHRVSDEVVKYATYPDVAAEIECAFVAKQYRRQHVGKMLIQKVEKTLKSLGYKKALIWSGPKYKATGWSFYDSLPGFKRGGFVDTAEFPVWGKVF